MAIKRYSAFPKVRALLKLHHQIVLCHILDIRSGSLTPQQHSSRPQKEKKKKESKKIDQYLDLTRELKKKLCNMKVTLVPMVVRVLGTVPKDLEERPEKLEIRRIETIQITKLARILRRVLDTWRDYVTQTSVKDHQLKLVLKTSKEWWTLSSWQTTE